MLHVQLRRWNEIGDKNVKRMQKACFWFANKKICIWATSLYRTRYATERQALYFFHCKMFAFSVGVRVHISSVLNWFSFRLHFISANSFRDAFGQWDKIMESEIALRRVVSHYVSGMNNFVFICSNFAERWNKRGEFNLTKIFSTFICLVFECFGLFSEHINCNLA